MFEALLIATGAEPVRLDIAGATQSQLHYLRTFADSRAIVAKVASAKRVVVVGASFIGSRSLHRCARAGSRFTWSGPQSVPLERVMGPEVGGYVRELHESHGVTFHLGRTVSRVDGSQGDAERCDDDRGGFHRPRRRRASRGDIAERAGLAIDRGISGRRVPGDQRPRRVRGRRRRALARSAFGRADPRRAWVVAERQGQAAARNILGHRERFDAVPFFWSQHYDKAINYVGHAENWDAVASTGRSRRNCSVTYKRGGRTLAVATIGRDSESLRAELALEQAQL